MPALFSLGQHSSLVAVQETLQPTECLMAVLDDTYLSYNQSGPQLRIVSWDTSYGHRQGSHCMLGRHRSGIRVADAHPVVKASLQESQTPTKWCGKATRLCAQTSKGLLSWGRFWGMHTSSPDFCTPRQRSTQFCPQDSCCAKSPVRVGSVVLLCCHGGQLFPSSGAT